MPDVFLPCLNKDDDDDDDNSIQTGAGRGGGAPRTLPLYLFSQ